MHPLLILAVGIAVVLGMIVGLRIHAFLALVSAAVVVSLLAPGPLDQKIPRVAEALGATAASIAIVIAMAAVVGQCMMASGAADRVVRAFLRLLGERRGGTALAASGFTLSIPVFFDTVFYLLIPLARSMYRRTGRHYLKYVMAIAAGGAVTHTLVPPTPGPMVIADLLSVDLGTMILLGIAVGLPAAAVGMAFAAWMDRRMPVVMRPLSAEDDEPAPLSDGQLPGLAISLLPIVLPIVLISANTITSRLVPDAAEGTRLASLAGWTALLGNPNLALMLSAAAALWIYVRRQKPSRRQTAAMVERALMSGAIIVLITAAGGAFGAMLRAAEIGPAIEVFLGDRSVGSDMPLLFVAFLVASLLKFAQGSSTVAMITAAGMMAAMVEPATLSYHPAYLAIAIGSGSLVGSWMNDSGFWIYCRMGGLTEVETLRTWTPLLALLGVTAMLVNMVLAVALPLR